ncbi:MAG TPA: methyltransferase domain-containing protein [Acetivibrio sp.]|uniref:class I SAM-dependent methyltransferase n=1 Tax=Acetivibrio sp. TaxID=1872092 RepID=UPI002BBB9D9A|nr:methyltransferase domain-containing protein [Acetivibrio sp.]HOM03421.1 methyltransferase domain-containing protein [Acetivibrio sp.]
MDSISIGKLDIALLSRSCEKPKLFEKGEELFWDDEHISKGMLEAHLNPDWDAASRKFETIRKSCDWIIQKLGLKESSEILDLGCGPGLYCSIFSEKGYNVTGIDYSKRSIDYAQNYAKEKNLSIEYRYMNYLDMDFEEKFDIVMMIYYDFAVLPYEDRDKLLGKIKRALKQKGHFIFDVMTPKAKKEPSKNWSINTDGGFWKPNPYMELFESFEYEENVVLSQHTIIEENGKVSIYRLWDKHYAPEELQEIMIKNGFRIKEVFSDFTGKEYTDDSESIAIIAENMEKER